MDSISASTLRDYPSARMFRTFNSPTLGLTPTAPFRGALYTYRLLAWVELLGFMVDHQTGQLSVRHAFKMTKGHTVNRSLTDIGGVTANQQASARSYFKFGHVLFNDSKYSQSCHMYIPIAHRWQEITWLLPFKAGLSIYSSLSYMGLMVIISEQGLDINATSVFIQHLKLNTTLYIT
jgi:hypothetical protein